MNPLENLWEFTKREIVKEIITTIGAIDKNPYQNVAAPKQRKIIHKKHAPAPGSGNRNKGWVLQNIKILLNF